MNDHRNESGRDASETPTTEYEAPRVESVVTSDEIEREAVFGGGISMM